MSKRAFEWTRKGWKFGGTPVSRNTGVNGKFAANRVKLDLRLTAKRVGQKWSFKNKLTAWFQTFSNEWCKVNKPRDPEPKEVSKWAFHAMSWDYAMTPQEINSLRGSNTVQLTSFLFCLDSASLLVLNKQQFYLLGQTRDKCYFPLWWEFSDSTDVRVATTTCKACIYCPESCNYST